MQKRRPTRRARISTRDFLQRLIPVDRLDADGRDEYLRLLSTESESAQLSGAWALLEKLCEVGYLRRLATNQANGALRVGSQGPLHSEHDQPDASRRRHASPDAPLGLRTCSAGRAGTSAPVEQRARGRSTSSGGTDRTRRPRGRDGGTCDETDVPPEIHTRGGGRVQQAHRPCQRDELPL